jgi:hypothetical protein
MKNVPKVAFLAFMMVLLAAALLTANEEPGAGVRQAGRALLVRKSLTTECVTYMRNCASACTIMGCRVDRISCSPKFICECDC